MSYKTDDYGSIRGVYGAIESDTYFPAVAETSAVPGTSIYDFPSAGIVPKQEDVTQEIDYCFNEAEYLKSLKTYIDTTYGQHYAKSKIQSTEFIMDAGHGEGFCIGNIIKYAQRYGKKAGKNRADLLKVCHYAIMMLHVHDQYNSE